MPDIRLSPGGIVPRDMTDRQWATYTTQASAEYYRSGQTAYDTGTGFWIGDVLGVPKLSIGNSAGNKVTWDGTTLTVVGNVTVQDGAITAAKIDVDELSAISADLGSITAGDIVLPSGGFIRSGQTAYDNGTGFYLGNDSGTPKFSIGDSGGNKLTWSGSILAVTGSLNFTNSVQTFTPTWGAGFSSDPTGDLSYLDFGAFVIVWTNAQVLGTSDDTTMSITNLPAAIEPSSALRGVPCLVVDDGGIYGGVADVLSSGSITFRIDQVSGARVGSSAVSFTNVGTKGLPSGFIIVYPK